MPASDSPALRNLGRGLAVPLGSVLFAFVVGGLLVAVTGADPFGAYQSLVCGGFGAFCTGNENPALQVSNTIVYLTPLITAGIAVALPFRAGLFNIGAEGQLLAGSVACTMIGIKFGDWPTAIVLPMALIGGMVAGAFGPASPAS